MLQRAFSGNRGNSWLDWHPGANDEITVKRFCVNVCSNFGIGVACGLNLILRAGMDLSTSPEAFAGDLGDATASAVVAKRAASARWFSQRAADWFS